MHYHRQQPDVASWHGAQRMHCAFWKPGEWAVYSRRLGTNCRTILRLDSARRLLHRRRTCKATDPDDYFHGAPELAVEVISASETAADVDRKVGLLLAHGSKAVWLIYQRTSKVQVHFTNGTGLSRGIGENLSLPELLPGWELPVAKLFE